LKKKIIKRVPQKHTLSAMSSIPLVVRTTLAPAFNSFSIRSLVISASLQLEKWPFVKMYIRYYFILEDDMDEELSQSKQK